MKANKTLQVCKNLKSQSSAYSLIKSLSSNKEPLLLVTLRQLDLYLYGKVIKVTSYIPLNSKNFLKKRKETATKKLSNFAKFQKIRAQFVSGFHLWLFIADFFYLVHTRFNLYNSGICRNKSVFDDAPYTKVNLIKLCI